VKQAAFGLRHTGTPFPTFTGFERGGPEKCQRSAARGQVAGSTRHSPPSSSFSPSERPPKKNVPLPRVRAPLLTPSGQHNNIITLPPEMTESYFWTAFGFLSFDTLVFGNHQYKFQR
jgi:hypothetical protein